MKYLQCQNCHHLNPLKSEYLTFCEGCGKKLSNTFAQWKELHPNKTFDTYKEIVGIDPEAVEAAAKPKKVNQPLKWMVIIAIIVSGISLAYFGLSQVDWKGLFTKSLVGETSDELLEQPWERYTYGDYGLSVELPAPLTETPVELPPQARAAVESFQMYQYAKDGIVLIVNSSKYVPAVEVDLRVFADGAIGQIQGQNGVQNLEIGRSPYTLEGREGMKLEGSCELLMVKTVIISVLIKDGQVLHSVTTMYPVDGENGKVACERVIESLRLQQ